MSNVAAKKTARKKSPSRTINIKSKNEARKILITAGIMTKNGNMKRNICNGGYYDERG